MVKHISCSLYFTRIMYYTFWIWNKFCVGSNRSLSHTWYDMNEYAWQSNLYKSIYVVANTGCLDIVDIFFFGQFSQMLLFPKFCLYRTQTWWLALTEMTVAQARQILYFFLDNLCILHEYVLRIFHFIHVSPFPMCSILALSEHNLCIQPNISVSICKFASVWVWYKQL